MILLEIFMSNTTSKIRWLVSMCSPGTHALAERISADINAAIILDRADPPWMWHLGLTTGWSDIPRAERARDAFITRSCDSGIWMQCYHTMRITHTVPELTYALCIRGDIDVIAAAVAHTLSIDVNNENNIIAFLYSPAALIARGNGDMDCPLLPMAMSILKLLATSTHTFIAIMGFEVACFAAYMYKLPMVMHIMARWTHTNDKPNTISMLCAAKCQRGDVSVMRNNMFSLNACAHVFTAAAIGGNLDIIKWCISKVSPHMLDYFIASVSVLCRQGHISLDAFKLLISHYKGNALDDNALDDNAKLSPDMPAEYAAVAHAHMR